MGKWKWLCEKIGKDRLWICIIGGLLLLVITYPIDEKKQEKYTIMGENDENIEKKEMAEGISSNPKTTYMEAMEEELSRVLSHMDGAGKTEVFISFGDYGSQVVEKDVSYIRNNEESMGMQEEKLSCVSVENTETTIYTVNKEGDEIPFVEKVSVPKVEGVLVVSRGGGNAIVEEEMKEAIMALFGIESHKIKVVKMKGEER